MDKTEFISLLKDLIAHLYDFSVLETHPLTEIIIPPEDFENSRGEYIRQVIIDEIEKFKPVATSAPPFGMEWRSYHILRKRYVEGESMQALALQLSLSRRQLRRNNNKALQALADRLWSKWVVFTGETDFGDHTSDEEQNLIQQTFATNLELLDLNGVVAGLLPMMRARLQVDGFTLSVSEGDQPLMVMADRVITRQILISLLSYFLSFPCKQEISLHTEMEEDQACVQIVSELVEPWSSEDEADHSDLLESVFYWSQQMGGEIQEHHPLQGQIGSISLTFRLPVAKKNIILVVDDQKPTQQMFRRFLSRTEYQLVGLTDSSNVLEMARQLHPKLITLDVMMPKVDGWEVLQALQTEPETKNIPVLVCSAWEEPELAKSLGAAGFLKKPVRQRDLLAALERLNL